MDWIRLDQWQRLCPSIFVIYMVCTTSDKQISRTFQGFFKDKLQFSRTKICLIKSAFFNPHLITLLDKTRHGVIYDFYVFGHTTFRNKTLQNNRVWLAIASEVQNSIWNKETEIKYCSCTKMFLRYPWVLQVLIHRGWAKFSSAK